MKHCQKGKRISGAALIFKALDQVGSDGKGRDGRSGYLRSLAKSDPPQFVALSRLLVDLKVPEEIEPKVFRTVEEVEADLRARGLPVPKDMFS